MNFAEARFWGLLLSGLGTIVLLRFILRCRPSWSSNNFDKLALFSLGLFLLLCVSPVTFAIFLVVAVGSYLGLQWVLKQPASQQQRYLYVLIPLQLLPLVYYKYANFAVNGILGLDVATVRNLVIPVGISFYTFQKVAFVVDTLIFREPLPHWLDYLNFAGFFPQIVAGPIERRRDLLPQMEQFRFRWSPANLNEGASWIALGLFFKLCLADNLAGYFEDVAAGNAYLIWMNNLLFGLRIYYDFAGYSLVAVGLGLCLGVKLTLNFRSPYCSTSSMEFWRRWHITLSQWFRDYLYIPLGGGRVRWWAFNLALVFVVSGIWHGAGWNFLLWGALHGGALIINRLFGRRAHLPAFPAWVLTMLTSFCAWLCFYETHTRLLLLKLKTLFTPGAYGHVAWSAFRANYTNASGFVLCGLLLLTSLVLGLEWLSITRRDSPYYFLRRPAVLGLLVVLFIVLAPEKDNGFIYFAF
jgi:D-alanyl-lipoteichoic acid acyltransferase DltB (MBOAT superfamily)